MLANLQQQHSKPIRKVLKPSSTQNSINQINGSKISKFFTNQTSYKQLQPKPQKPSISFKQNQITQQLSYQIQQIQQCLKQQTNITQFKRSQKKKRSMKEEIISIDEIIRLKDYEINAINQQIKYLKNVKDNTGNMKNGNLKNGMLKEQEQQSFGNKIGNQQGNGQQENNIFKLAQELKNHREFLVKLQNQYKNKQGKLNQIKQLVGVYEEKYVQKCHDTKERPLRYEEFKELNEEKKREIEAKANKKLQAMQNKYKQSLIKDYITPGEGINRFKQAKNQKQSVNPVPQTNKKTLKQLQNRKIIAQQALKNARKKHNNQLNQLMAKIQFLRDQDALLFEKIKQKQQEKEMLQTKFQQKGGIDGLSFRLHTQNRVLNPNSNRSSRDLLMKSSQKKLKKSISTSAEQYRPYQQMDQPANNYMNHRRLISSRRGEVLSPYKEIDEQRKRKMTERTQAETKLNMYDDYEQQSRKNNIQ